MRNLKLQHCKRIAATLPGAKFLLLDPNSGSGGGGGDEKFFIATSQGLHAYNTNTGVVEELVELPDIVGCEFLALDNEICVGTAGGEVLLVNPQTKATSEGTFCDVGIDSMAWSPDQEVVVFVTKTHNVVVMSCTYEPLAEHTLADEAFGEGEFITVGWGKKETQFHGTAGKSAAKQQSDFKPPTAVEALPQQVEITWRADASYFAVSYVNQQMGRCFKVFDKEGRLSYSSEKQNELQPALAWRPSGNWLAMPQRLPQKSTVALFEKNGLRHREIVLPFTLDAQPIEALKWSSDSDILAVQSVDTQQGMQHLYLYTIGNYHWYLKQVLSFPLSDALAVCVWDTRIGEEKTLHVLLESGAYLIYSWHFAIDQHADQGIVAVIDGPKLLLTDFAKAVVPPPMCSKELQLDANINACGIIVNDCDELLLFAYDAQQVLHIFKSSCKSPLNFELQCALQPTATTQLLHSTPIALGNMLWLSSERLIAGTCDARNSKIRALSIDYDACTYAVTSTLQVASVVHALGRGSAHMEQFFVQTHDGRMWQLSFKADGSLRQDAECAQLMQGAAQQLLWWESRDLEHQVLIALRSNQCLYLDGVRFASDVTSCCLAGNYLAYSKLTSLHFLRLSDRCIVSERKVERGSKLVTTLVKDARIVLQLPRGNLEAISPRVLALELVAALLERQQYEQAMQLLRKQRINLNIICDHNMCSFVQHLGVFLQDIKNPNWLNLFLSDLQNEDFSYSMYASNYKAGSQLYPEGFKVTDKVRYLCERMCTLMEQSTDARYRLPIITAYVKLGRLEKALDVIWQQHQGDSAADDSLKYLLYLVDVNELYNVALGSYDFGLVLFVAQKSQKDPKEFLPFLNELKALEINYCKFKIDEHLKRYERALTNIAQCGAAQFAEALEFIKRHALYQSALQCYQEQQDCYRQICLAFADHLRAQNKLENASIMYERGGNMTQALLSAKHVLDWRRALTLAKQEGQELQAVVLSMLPALQENGQHATAFALLQMHGGSATEALQYLLNGRLFLQAIHEARMLPTQVESAELIATLITPALDAYKTTLESTLAADQELFVSYKQRLLDIRVQRAKKQQLQQLGEEADYAGGADIDECDLLSDTSSMNSSRYTSSSRGSGSTGKTFRSSKNRRKHERKLLSLKPGNPFEDIALIDALHNHIVKIAAQQQHMRDTCKALMELREDVAAADLQQRYKQLLTLLQESLDAIWLPELMTAQQFLTGPNIDYTQLQNEQRYAMINPQKRFKPQLTFIDWEHEILR